jgi:peptidoglycan glycosyltransferase
VTGGSPHVWFTGFAPVNADPNEAQIAIAVLIESGGAFGESATGGSVAAPIAAELFEEYLR